MQRFINDPDQVVEDTVKGFVKAHSDILRVGQNPRVIVAKDAPVAGKVGVVTGGGSGHEPGFMGYTGRNMLDAVAVGELFPHRPQRAFRMPSARPMAAPAWCASMAIMPATT